MDKLAIGDVLVMTIDDTQTVSGAWVVFYTFVVGRVVGSLKMGLHVMALF